MFLNDNFRKYGESISLTPLHLLWEGAGCFSMSFEGDVGQLVKHLMTFLALLYTYITAQTLFEIASAGAHAYDGDCVIVALNLCPSQARQFESTLIRTQRIISDVRGHLLSSRA